MSASLAILPTTRKMDCARTAMTKIMIMNHRYEARALCHPIDTAADS